jgi:hypothetical protein
MAPKLRTKRTLAATWSTGRKRVVNDTRRISAATTKRSSTGRIDRKSVAEQRAGSSSSAPVAAAAGRRKKAAAATVRTIAELISTNRPVTRSSRMLQEASLPATTRERSSTPSTGADSGPHSRLGSPDTDISSPAQSVASHVSPDEAFPIFMLPTELRLMILDYALNSSDHVNVSCSHRALSLMNKQADAMKRTCKQMHIETSDVLMRRRSLVVHTTLETAARGADFTWLFNMEAWRPNSRMVHPRETLRTLIVNWVLPPDAQAKIQGIGASEVALLADARSTMRQFECLQAFCIYTTNFTNSGGLRRSRRAIDKTVYCIEFIEKERCAADKTPLREDGPSMQLDETQVMSLDASLLQSLPGPASITSVGSHRASWTRLVGISRRTNALTWVGDDYNREAAYKAARRWSGAPYKATMERFIDEDLSLGTASRDALIEITYALTRSDRGPMSRWQVRIFRMPL